MKKHIVIAVASLILASGLDASGGLREEYCFRQAFQKKLKHVKSVGLRSFNLLGLKQKLTKKLVFVDLRKLYWGKLSDLISSAEESFDDGTRAIAGTEQQSASSIDTEDSQAFAKELRQELKSFAKQYGLKIVWRKKLLDLPDATAAFLEYWDKGFSKEQRNKVISFAELCALSVGDTSVRDKSVGNTTIRGTSVNYTDAKEIKIKVSSTRTLSKNTQLENAPFANVFRERVSREYVPLGHESYANLLLRKGA